jgi:hypothetical protein
VSEALSELVNDAWAPASRAFLEEGTFSHRSDLFTVRLWPEEIENGEVERRGEVRHVMSGQSRYFRE